MRYARLLKHLVYAKLGFHYGVVRGGEHGVHAVRYKRLHGKGNLVHCGAGVFAVGNAVSVKIFLGVGYCGGGGILPDVVKQGYVLGVRVCGGD